MLASFLRKFLYLNHFICDQLCFKLQIQQHHFHVFFKNNLSFSRLIPDRCQEGAGDEVERARLMREQWISDGFLQQ